MYKNFSHEGLGVSGRHSELIELALTYRFKGMDLDLPAFAKQVGLRGLEHASRFLKSANIKIGGFDLPMRWQGDDSVYQEDLDNLPKLAEVAASIGATGARTIVMAASDDRPYHENFEFHRQRFTEIADALAPFSIRLGLDFHATAVHREGQQHSFIHSPDALLTLAKTVGVANVGVSVDLWKWHVSGGNVDQLRDVTADQIVMVRAADVPADVSLESITDEQRLLPGASGIVDTASAIRLLIEMGYEGPITPYPNASQFSGVTRDGIVKAASKSLDDAGYGDVDDDEDGEPKDEDAAKVEDDAKVEVKAEADGEANVEEEAVPVAAESAE